VILVLRRGTQEEVTPANSFLIPLSSRVLCSSNKGLELAKSLESSPPEKPAPHDIKEQGVYGPRGFAAVFWISKSWCDLAPNPRTFLVKRDFPCLQGTLKPTVEDLADKGEAAVSDFTEDTLKPAAKKVAENAEPKTKEFTEKTLKPTAKQVQTESLTSSCG
jgi:hypothetical protein